MVVYIYKVLAPAFDTSVIVTLTEVDLRVVSADPTPRFSEYDPIKKASYLIPSAVRYRVEAKPEFELYLAKVFT